MSSGEGEDYVADSDGGRWRWIMSEFENSPGQQEVIKILLERGFSVNDEGRVVSGDIEIPNTGLAREAGVDRRVVDSTTKNILENEELKDIFQNISSIPSLKDVAPVIGLSVLTIHVTDASCKGVIAEITDVIAQHGVSIRQAVSNDPYFSDDPCFSVITHNDPPTELIKELSELEFVENIEVTW